MKLRFRFHETRAKKAEGWSICKLISRTFHQSNGENTHSYTITDNAVTTDPLPAYAYSDDYPEAIISADGISRRGLLDLPVELLLEICQYCRFSDVYSLIRVNTMLYAVGVQRFYSIIPIRLGDIHLSSVQVPYDAPLSEILSVLKGQRSSILSGLFANRRYLDAVQTVVFCGGWGGFRVRYRQRYGVLDTLVQGIFLHCTRIRNVVIKGRTKNRPWDNLDGYISFKGVIFPESLSTVCIDMTSTLTQTLLSGIASLTVLEIQDWEGSRSLDQISPDLGVTLIELKCLWDLSSSPTEEFGVFSKQLASLVPNLKRLAIGYKTVDEGNNVHMSPAILDAYLSVTRYLHYLEDLTLLYFGHQEYPMGDTSSITSELELVQQLSKARPELQRLTLYNYRHSGSECVLKEVTTWKKSRENSEQETWTFDPAITDH